MRLIKNLQDGKQIIFDQGKFDQWCVYIVSPNGTKTAPLDTQYFKELQSIAVHYPGHKVYRDFVAIYEQTTRDIDPKVLQLIDDLCKTYKPPHQADMEKWLSVLYAGMIAEENKANAILKKRIKRLGMHQTLVFENDPEFAAQFSKGKAWKELDALMKNLGF